METPHPLDLEATVPDIEAALSPFAAASATAREAFCFRSDLGYGSTRIESLDFFSAGPGTPVVAFFHGGYWRRLDKSDFSFVAAGLVPLGVSVASVNYGLVPETPLPEIVSQCRRAIAWLTTNAGELQVDPERISALGHSAGGHLAAMTAVAFGLRSVVSISGLHDLLPLRLDERQARALSPIAHPPIGRVPIFATAGELESEAFRLQSRSLVDAWAPLGCPAEYVESPGDDHFSICLRLRNPADVLTRRVASLAAA